MHTQLLEIYMDPIRYIDRASVASGRLYDLKKKVYLMVLDDSLHPSTDLSPSLSKYITK